MGHNDKIPPALLVKRMRRLRIHIISKSPKCIPLFQIQVLRHLVSSFSRANCSHVDTLGAEKKSGVPYILTSHARHRQTPSSKHDQKTRHVGLAHVAQPSYLAYSYFGEVLHEARYAVAYVAGGLSGLPSSSEGSGHAGRVTLPWDPRFCPLPWEAAVAGRPPYRSGHAGRVTLPIGRDGARTSLGFGPVAGTWCRSPPRNRVAKSHTRRCQRSAVHLACSGQDGKSISQSPAGFKRGFHARSERSIAARSAPTPVHSSNDLAPCPTRNSRPSVASAPAAFAAAAVGGSVAVGTMSSTNCPE